MGKSILDYCSVVLFRELLCVILNVHTFSFVNLFKRLGAYSPSMNAARSSCLICISFGHDCHLTEVSVLLFIHKMVVMKVHFRKSQTLSNILNSHLMRVLCTDLVNG